MPEAVTGYPKWTGELSKAPRVLAIAIQETRRGLNDSWGRSALILAFGYAVITLAQLAYIADSRPSVHSQDTFLTFLGLLRWAALGIAAIMAGPALLEDDKKGALELYLSRSVTRPTYLAGKLLAVLGLTFLTIFGPALAYYAGSFLVFEEHPEGWAYVILGAAGYAAIWSLVVCGLGLGLSCLVRSSRAATLLLFGAVAAMDIVLGNLLEGITRSEAVQVLSPMSSLAQQGVWLFGTEAPFDFPWWWGLLMLGGLAAIGWTLFAWRHPRLKGVE